VHGPFSNYVLDPNTGPCHRTQCALRLLVPNIPLRRWERFVEGRDDGTRDEALVRIIYAEILGKVMEEVEAMCDELSVGERSFARDVLRERWDQIRVIAKTNIERLKT